VAPFKALLTVTSEANDAGGMSSDLIVADSRGRIVARSNMRFKTSFDALNEQMNAAPPSDKGTPVELPARTKRLMEMVKKMMGSSPQAIEDPEIRTALLNPATHDPLELVVGDSAVAAASALGQNLVLQPHDVLFMTMLFQLVMGQPVAETFFDRLATIGDMHLEREEGWLLARPNRPIWANEQLLDRKAAADLFESYKRENRMSLDALAKFSLAQGREPILLMFLAMFIFPESGDQLYGSWDVLKYFGSLSAEQRTAAEKHATYKFSQLSPAQITLLAGMVFKSRPNMTYTHDEAGGNPYELLSSEVTEAFPNGVPPDGELELSMQNEPVVFASASSPGAYNPSPRPMTTHELAWEAFTKERQDLFPWGAESPTYDRFQEGKSQLWTFEFKLNKHLAVHKQLRDNTYDPRSPKLKLDQLPEKFRSEVTAKIEELRKSHANSKPGDFGGARKTNKPPLR
ncbi:MAG TPA: hypothetical protein VEX38_08615, partial [Fimbriimonadaceae bacterium]|nr:hypothetical protein [Fimbriimonadaceae bacterium]